MRVAFSTICDIHRVCFTFMLDVFENMKWILIVGMVNELYYLCATDVQQIAPWIGFNDHGYYFIGNKTTYSVANATCKEKHQANLASITSQAENDFVFTKVEEKGSLGDQAWIGLRKRNPEVNCSKEASEECRDRFMWEDGADMKYKGGWAENEPAIHEGCARMTTNYWAGDSCSKEYAYVCKKSLCHADFIVCQNGGTCGAKNRVASCDCQAGFTGSTCETEINECHSNPCNNGDCADAVNEYTCDCKDGYSGTHCETETDECVSDPCLNGGTCTDLVNGFNCTCDDLHLGINCGKTVTQEESQQSWVDSLNQSHLKIALGCSAVIAFGTGAGAIFMTVRYRRQSEKIKKHRRVSLNTHDGTLEN